MTTVAVDTEGVQLNDAVYKLLEAAVSFYMTAHFDRLRLSKDDCRALAKIRSLLVQAEFESEIEQSEVDYDNDE